MPSGHRTLETAQGGRAPSGTDQATSAATHAMAETVPSGRDRGRRCTGLLVLNFVTVIWGSQHALVKDIVTDSQCSSVLNALRFLIAACALSTAWLLCRPRGGPIDWPALLLAGGELAVWQSLGFSLQLVGLFWTTASRSAFLIYLNAPLVPIFSWLLGERTIGLRSVGTTCLAVAGTLLLTYDGGLPNLGDLFCVGAAASSAMFILRLSRHSRRHDITGLTAVTRGLTAAVCCAVVAVSVAASADGLSRLRHDLGMLLAFSWHGLQLLYLSLVTTALAGWLQAWAQARVRAHEAVVIYTMDPVYAALFSWVLLGERLHPYPGFVGVALVLCANVLRQVPWEAWEATRDLLTPLADRRGAAREKSSGQASEAATTASDSKTAPLLRAERY